ncbi:MAG: HAD family hydrolase [Deltaproteobacteria bacterium]|nr:HAD family hydrolase [Deltaproteobacteria bacterium]
MTPPRPQIARKECDRGPAPAAWAHKDVWIFDFDGTLVDSMTHFTDLAERIIHEHLDVPPVRARELYRTTSGLPFIDQMEQCFPGDARNPAAVAAFEGAKRTTYLRQPLFPDTREALEVLRDRGRQVVISSNNSQALVEAYCRTHQLPARIVCGWRPGFAKGPAHFAHIAAVSGKDPAVMLFIGDSLKDAERARVHGLDFVARAGTFTAREFQTHFPSVPVVHSLLECVELVSKPSRATPSARRGGAPQPERTRRT